MNKTPSEMDYYNALLKRELPLFETLIDDTDLTEEAMFEYAALKVQIHFSTRYDTDAIRDVLAQDPEETKKSHTLASLIFAHAATELQNTLMENSHEPTNHLIGPIIGIEVPVDPVSVEAPPLSVKDRLELYRALPEDRRAVFDRAVASRMKLQPE